MTESSSWTELRYSATQALPEPDGLRDELDPIAYWRVDAVRVFDDGSERIDGQAAVAVFDLARGPELLAAANAYSGPVLTAARLLLDEAGALRPAFGSDADRVVLFLGVTIGQPGRNRGLGLAAAQVIRERLGSARSLIGCFPEPPAVNAESPEFFAGVPEPIQRAWWERGLAYVGDGLWTLPAPEATARAVREPAAAGSAAPAD